MVASPIQHKQESPSPDLGAANLSVKSREQLDIPIPTLGGMALQSDREITAELTKLLMGAKDPGRWRDISNGQINALIHRLNPEGKLRGVSIIVPRVDPETGAVTHYQSATTGVPMFKKFEGALDANVYTTVESLIKIPGSLDHIVLLSRQPPVIVSPWRPSSMIQAISDLSPIQEAFRELDDDSAKIFKIRQTNSDHSYEVTIVERTGILRTVQLNLTGTTFDDRAQEAYKAFRDAELPYPSILEDHYRSFEATYKPGPFLAESQLKQFFLSSNLTLGGYRKDTVFSTGDSKEFKEQLELAARILESSSGTHVTFIVNPDFKDDSGLFAEALPKNASQYAALVRKNFLAGRIALPKGQGEISAEVLTALRQGVEEGRLKVVLGQGKNDLEVWSQDFGEPTGAVEGRNQFIMGRWQTEKEGTPDTKVMSRRRSSFSEEITELAEVHHIPACVQGGNISKARVGGQNIVFVGSADFEATASLYRKTSLGLSDADITKIYSKAFSADKTIILPNTEDMFHIDQLVSFPREGVAVIALPIEFSGLSDLELKQRLTRDEYEKYEALKSQPEFEKLRTLFRGAVETLQREGFEIITLETSYSNMTHKRGYTNFIPISREGGGTTLIMPSFVESERLAFLERPRPMGKASYVGRERDPLAIQKTIMREGRNGDLLKAHGFEVTYVSDHFWRSEGNSHCLVGAVGR